MAWKIETTSSLLQGSAFTLFNHTKVQLLPQPAGAHGINDQVWRDLIALTRSQYRAALGVDLAASDNLKGACIYASVIAAKFYRHQLGYKFTRVIHVGGASDHYFAVAHNDRGAPLIADITSKQFPGAPDYIVGRLSEIKDIAKRVKVTNGPSLYEAYVLGARTDHFLM